MYGGKSIEWNAFDDIFMLSQDKMFIEAQHYLARNFYQFDEVLESIRTSNFADLSHDRRLAGDQRRFSFKTLLPKYGNSQCSDVRDRVFAFLGLAPDGHLVEVDYSLEANELWARVMKSYPALDRAVFGMQLEFCLNLDVLDISREYGALDLSRDLLLTRLKREANPEQGRESKPDKAVNNSASIFRWMTKFRGLLSQKDSNRTRRKLGRLEDMDYQNYFQNRHKLVTSASRRRAA